MVQPPLPALLARPQEAPFRVFVELPSELIPLVGFIPRLAASCYPYPTTCASTDSSSLPQGRRVALSSVSFFSSYSRVRGFLKAKTSRSTPHCSSF